MSIEVERTTRRIAISVEYDGSGYRGWQAQKHPTRVVQKQVEKALSQIADEPVQVTCSGRTDSGVHASSQVCHFDTQAERDSHNWIMGGNTQLPNDVSLSWVKEVDASFHARFSALSRQYVYLIQLSGIRGGLLSNAVTFTHKELDSQLMAQAGRWLVGTHDFNAYRSTQCQAKTSVRRLMQLNVHQHYDVIAVHVEANGFLQNMVRNIVGVLIAIGAREASVDWSRDVLDSKDRTQGGVTAAPDGLYFLGPSYSSKFDLSETVRIPQIARDILRTDPLQCLP